MQEGLSTAISTLDTQFKEKTGYLTKLEEAHREYQLSLGGGAGAKRGASDGRGSATSSGSGGSGARSGVLV